VSTTVLIAVEDEGPGIPLEEREKATDRFYRGESARSTPGSGLGLSLVLAVAQLHGGTFRLEDNRPGLRAILSLPLPEAAEVRQTASRQTASRQTVGGETLSGEATSRQATSGTSA
jgi:signal transduction histidine kinase